MQEGDEKFEISTQLQEGIKNTIKCTKLRRVEAIMCFGCLFLGVFLKSV